MHNNIKQREFNITDEALEKPPLIIRNESFTSLEDNTTNSRYETQQSMQIKASTSQQNENTMNTGSDTLQDLSSMHTVNLKLENALSRSTLVFSFLGIQVITIYGRAASSKRLTIDPHACAPVRVERILNFKFYFRHTSKKQILKPSSFSKNRENRDNRNHTDRSQQ